jgi:PIN domain nuclease of toxin-antitoxin system
MELEVGGRRPEIPEPPRIVILLDTNALIWVDQAHARTRPLMRARRRLYISPASLLELQFLEEAGRIRLRRGSVHSMADDERWMLDDPPAGSWFIRALDVGWTRDPFDRLIVAHAHLRGWRLATADQRLIDGVGPAACLRL